MVLGLAARIAATGCEMRRPAIVQIIAINGGDDGMGKAQSFDRPGDTRGLGGIESARGKPVLTLQKAQARVQVSPMIMKVACFFSQHSPMFGQPASSQTVTSPCSRTIFWVAVHAAEPGALTLIQAGLRATG